MIVLGLETSCDETAVALVDDGRRVLGQVIASQDALHAGFGGVVPEVAARAHLDRMRPAVDQVFAEAGLARDRIDGVAATCGPGLIGGVLVGATFGKALAWALARPFVAINHLEAHALTARLSDDVQFPFLLALMSGGHAFFAAVDGVGTYTRLGGTLDDAVGEAFDKVAKMLGLGFPGGPAVERAAASGDPARFRLPRPLIDRPGCDLSLSGLKTAVRLAAERLPPGPLAPQDVADLCASFQAAVGDVLADRLVNAVHRFEVDRAAGASIVVAGGVAANRYLRARLAAVAETQGMRFVAPPPRLCTDNGAMVAWAGLERLRLGEADGATIAARPRWPLDSLRPPGASP